jgi:hypothetical protein
MERYYVLFDAPHRWMTTWMSASSILMLLLFTTIQPGNSFVSLSQRKVVIIIQQPRQRDYNVRSKVLLMDCSETENDGITTLTTTIQQNDGDNQWNLLHDTASRRDFFRQAAISSLSSNMMVGNKRIIPTFVVPSTFVGGPFVGAAHAAVMDPTLQKVFVVGKDLTPDQAIQRFHEGKQSLQYLVEHYDEICEAGGGDNVRRYLGTVGVGSGLYGIGKVLKVLQKSDDMVEDVVEFSELSEELISAINQADGSAYMAIFTTFSSSSTPPKKYFDDSKVEAQTALRIINELSQQLNVK